MANFVLVYTGGDDTTQMTEDQQNAVMADWTAWYGKMADKVVDGGNPFSGSKTLNANGVHDGAGDKPLTGYTVISADSLDAATELVKDHPHLKHNGEVTIYETFEM